MKMKIVILACILATSLTGCFNKENVAIDVGSGLKAGEQQATTQNGPRADIRGSATVEAVEKETKVRFVFKNQSDKTITVEGGAHYTLQKGKNVIETDGVPVKDYIDLQPGQEYKGEKTFTNLEPGNYRIEFVWNKVTAATEFVQN